MATEDELDIDIMRFFEQIENQEPNDKIKTLRLLMDKYIHLSKSSHMMDNADLFNIISQAKSMFARKAFPVFFGERCSKVLQSDQPNLCVIESTIVYLNKNDCLKKMPKFDYRENE